MNLWVIAVVGAVCSIFLLFIYSRFVWSRIQEQRRILNESNPDDPSLQFQSRGLDSFITHSLPITQFKKKNEEELSQSNTECAVCLGEFEEGECLKHLPNCSHAFHVPCIDTWFQNHSTCPLCRSQIYDFTPDHEYSVSINSLLETLRREDFLRQRLA
ncbi:RING-H2 finger protein ATL16-like [Cornus florida]|uniref:RING-H2 finger protein ATL16-like n=1 Tax=Cornus florida TaxID=4283 RepID=UPI0028964F6B|nr:RING-H2 finger protein ATL16-like [Cornus florida]